MRGGRVVRGRLLRVETVKGNAKSGGLLSSIFTGVQHRERETYHHCRQKGCHSRFHDPRGDNLQSLEILLLPSRFRWKLFLVRQNAQINPVGTVDLCLYVPKANGILSA